MSQIIGTKPECSGLGDILILTPLCREFPNSTVELTAEANKRFGTLFKDIANVVVTPTPFITPDVGEGHFAIRKLRSIGRPNANYLPEIKITDEELNWAKDIIKPYDSPIILSVNTAIRHKRTREFNPVIWQEIVDELSKTRTVLQFGLSSNFTKLNNVVEFKDVEIRQTASIFAAVGDYVGVDTGDMHLMVSVGGNLKVLVPRSSLEYQHVCWHYNNTRVKYILVENYKNMLI